MKKFLFRLETLLKVRRVREGRLKHDLAHAAQKWNQIKEQEQTLHQQVSSLTDEIQKQRQEGDLHLQETYTQILNHLNTSLESVQHSLFAHEKQVEVLKQHLKQAIQERKVIEKIKDKHYTGWRIHSVQTEGEFLDECGPKTSPNLK